jgi:hypothetical protein
MSNLKSDSGSESLPPFDGRVLMVMSHPNHEAAVLGIVQRLRPRLVVLTDGGGGARVEQSRTALASIGLLDGARFLNFPESEFYRALLDRDLPFFKKVADRLREEIEAYGPERASCDAVEFYNPVHDIALPILYAALGCNRDVAMFEVPLIYQTAATSESYEIQRFPPSRSINQIVFHLDEEELRVKLQMRDQVYALLRRQLGRLLSDLGSDHFATEVIGPATPGASLISNEQILRYEWRARLLLQRGAIKQVITHAGHYLPMAEALMN